MSAPSVFLKDIDYYQRNLDPLKHYVDQTSFYLHRSTGRDQAFCRDYVVKSIRGQRFPDARDPTVTYFERGDNLDRAIFEISLSQYLKTAIADDQIVAPTFTTYVPPKREPSLLTEFTDINTKMRSVVKKKAQIADAEKKVDLYIALNNEQDNYKRYNNALSGIFNAVGNILNNPTAHSTLTTITRTLSSLSNASNEKIISGNRHYRDPDVTLSNIISICAGLDRDKFDRLMRKYKLHWPSVEEVMEVVFYSSDLYWRDRPAAEDIRRFVSTLLPVERAAFVYIGDLYHLRRFNPDFVRGFLEKLSRKCHDKSVKDPITVLKTTDEQVINYAHQVCLEITGDIGKDYNKISSDDQVTLATTALNIIDTVAVYRDFVDEIFLTDNLPASTAYITTMVRRTVVLSDTDSTMFSVDDWVMWYFGKLDFSEQGFALAGGIMFIATQCIAHSLAVFSANIGVERKKLFTLAMKPEFCFPVFGQTLVAKHYYTMQLVKEGNVRKVAKDEVKGVHLKNSAVPKDIIASAQAKMREILDRVMAGSRIKLIDEIVRVARIEQEIQTSILSGGTKFYKVSKIKPPSSYASPDVEKTPYQYHLFWQQVFEPAYGKVEDPTYYCVKIPTTLHNKTALKNWVDSIADAELKARLITWITRKGKKDLNNFYFSKEWVESHGLPKEIVPIVNTKKVMLEMTTADRMVLESLGYAAKSGWLLCEQDCVV